MAIFDILDQGINYLDRGLSNLGQSVREKKLETFGSNIFGGDREGFSREELQAEFEQQIKGIEEARMAPVSEEEREKLEDQFYEQKLKDLDKVEPAKDYSAYKAPKQQSTRPSSITAPKPSLGSSNFSRRVREEPYDQIQRGLNIVDLNKLLDEAMGTRAKVNVFNSLFGGRGLL
mgnify:FL=1|tara:strand:- start:139 stop:663 length:525 start_codon:yes stop_codon:yes gene_type:complete